VRVCAQERVLIIAMVYIRMYVPAQSVSCGVCCDGWFVNKSQVFHNNLKHNCTTMQIKPNGKQAFCVL